jgi:hypothetical protein
VHHRLLVDADDILSLKQQPRMMWFMVLVPRGGAAVFQICLAPTGAEEPKNIAPYAEAAE